MKGYLPLLLLFVPFYLDAQLKDYIPQQPLQGAVAAKNYKQYILAHKIKSVTKWKVDTISKVPKKDHYLSFTNTGDTAQVYDYNPEAAVYKINCQRDKMGRLLEEDYYLWADTLVPWQQEKYSYVGLQPMAVTKKYLMLNGRQTQKKETYLRDKSGKMKLIERYDSTGSFVEEKEIYKYDNQGLLTMLTHFQREPVSDTSKAVSPPKMRIDQTINYFYDVMKRMTEVKHFTGKAKTPRQVETYQYDPVGNMIEYSDNRAPQGGKITITYDAKNSVVFCEFRNSTGVLIRSVGSTYASHENLVQEIDSDLQGKDLIKHKKIYKYKYFKDDNISGSEVFIGTNRIEKISYIYEFYPKVP